jgi:hypothetical protein
VKPIGFAAVVAVWLCTPAGAEWHVDKSKNRLSDRDQVIAWSDAAEPADGITAKLQVECLHDRLVGVRSVVLVFSEPMTPGQIGLSFRFDQGAIEHRLLPVGTDLRSVPLSGISADRFARSKRFRIAVHQRGAESRFYEFDLTGSAAAIGAVRCRR